MDNKIEIPDQETAEILKEMQAEGIKAPGQQEEVKVEVAVEPSETEAPAEVKVEEESEDVELPDRPKNNSLPLSKFNKYKDKWETKESEYKAREAEMRAQLDSLNNELLSAKSEKQVNLVENDILQLSQKYNVSHDFIKDQMALAAKMYGTDELKTIKAELEELRQGKQDAEQERMFSTEFSQGLDFKGEKRESVLPLIKQEYPNITPDKIEEIKNTLYEISFDERYAGLPLAEIYSARREFRGIEVPKKIRTAEPSRMGTQPSKVVDFENITDDDIDSMDDATFDEFSKYMEKQSKLKIRRH
jgi:hypothetical protein